jgi:hypothetical protein
MNEFYLEIIKPFLAWVQANQIQTFVDVIGDMGFVLLIPFVLLCCIKYLTKE